LGLGRFKIIEKVDTVIPELENEDITYDLDGNYYIKENDGKIYRGEPISGLAYKWEAFRKALSKINETVKLVN